MKSYVEDWKFGSKGLHAQNIYVDLGCQGPDLETTNSSVHQQHIHTDINKQYQSTIWHAGWRVMNIIRSSVCTISHKRLPGENQLKWQIPINHLKNCTKEERKFPKNWTNTGESERILHLLYRTECISSLFSSYGNGSKTLTTVIFGNNEEFIGRNMIIRKCLLHIDRTQNENFWKLQRHENVCNFRWKESSMASTRSDSHKTHWLFNPRST